MTGRKPKLTELQQQRLLEDYEDGKDGIKDLMEIYSMSRSAVYAAITRALERRDVLYRYRQSGDTKLRPAPALSQLVAQRSTSPPGEV